MPTTKTDANKSLKSRRTSRRDRVIVAPDSDWEMELDMLGPMGDQQELAALMERAPSGSEEARFAAGVLGAARVGIRTSDDFGLKALD